MIHWDNKNDKVSNEKSTAMHLRKTSLIAIPRFSGRPFTVYGFHADDDSAADKHNLSDEWLL